MRFPLQQITNPNKNNCTCKQKNTTNEKKKKKGQKKFTLRDRQHIYNNKQLYLVVMLKNGLFQEKTKWGGLRIYLFEPPLEFMIFLLYPWKFQIKQSSNFEIPHAISLIPLEVPYPHPPHPHPHFFVIFRNSPIMDFVPPHPYLM